MIKIEGEKIMTKILSIFAVTLLLTFSGNLFAHCGDAEAHAKASQSQSHDESNEGDKKEKDKDKG